MTLLATRLGSALGALLLLSTWGCAASSGVDDPGPSYKPLEVGGDGGSSGSTEDPNDVSSSGGWANGGGECSAGDVRDCYSGDPSTLGVGSCAAGQQTCDNGAWGACTGQVLPSTEVCDGALDENCDGQVDEGCCVTKQYERETGLVSGSGSVCCDAGDQLVDAVDCGVGQNHTHSVNGDCATGSEGAGNDGSACVQITCETTQCK